MWVGEWRGARVHKHVYLGGVICKVQRQSSPRMQSQLPGKDFQCNRKPTRPPTANRHARQPPANCSPRHPASADLQSHLPPAWRPRCLSTTSASTQMSFSSLRLKPVTHVPGLMRGQCLACGMAWGGAGTMVLGPARGAGGWLEKGPRSEATAHTHLSRLAAEAEVRQALQGLRLVLLVVHKARKGLASYEHDVAVIPGRRHGARLCTCIAGSCGLMASARTSAALASRHRDSFMTPGALLAGRGISPAAVRHRARLQLLPHGSHAAKCSSACSPHLHVPPSPCA